MSITVRKARVTERDQLVKLWCNTFSDNADLVYKFEALWPCCDHALVAGTDAVESALWDIDCGVLAAGAENIPLKMLYAVATHSDFRGKGNAGALIKSLPAADFPGTRCCSPADDALRDWYLSLGLLPYFYCDRGESRESGKASGTLYKISDKEYVMQREAFLSGRVHDIPNEKALMWQQAIFDTYGGGYFRIDTDRFSSLSLVCCNGDSINIGELLCDVPWREEAVQLLMQHFGVSNAHWRAPAVGTGVPCDLLTHPHFYTFSAAKQSPWLGFIFD